ncbi:MAG: HAMP domain-containing sensor histidine kinase [Patescibacteria group bacterium]
MNNIFNYIKNIKITYKIGIIFSIIFYILINSWFFSYTTAKDVQDSFVQLENYSFPYLLTTNSLKDNIHAALLAVYDYVATGNSDSKATYQERMREALENSISLFELSRTEQDLQFTSKFIEDQIDKIDSASQQAMQKYESNPQAVDLSNNLEQLRNLKNDFNIFIENDVNTKIQNQVNEANAFIAKRTNLITMYLILVITIVLIIIILLIIFIYTNITKPVNILTDAVRQFGHGKLVKVDIKRQDELGLFAQTFNKMASDIMATQKALQEELSKTKALDQQKSEFLSIAAHQLRTPMSGIKWMLQMLLDGDMGNITPEQKHHLENGMQNSERMIKLINDLLDVTKIEQQKFQYKLSPVSSIALIDEIINDAHRLAKDKKITLSVQHRGDDSILMVDKEKIIIAISNILDNAIKYSPANKEIVITTTIENDKFLCTISDQGYGIPKNQQDQIFSKFYRGSNILKIETDLETIGTGLGLYIAKDIITKHDGDITFTSEEGKGTTFYIKLPIK